MRTQGKIRLELVACEEYINSGPKFLKDNQERIRAAILIELLEVQLATFDRS